MSITDPTSAMEYKTRDVSGTVSGVVNKITQTFGEVSLGGGYRDWAGMNAQMLPEFNSAVDKFENKIKEIIEGFNPDGNLETALKGDVNTAVKTFLTNFKGLLRRYVEVLDVEKKEAAEAAERFKAGAGVIAKSVTSHASKVGTQAKKLELD